MDIGTSETRLGSSPSHPLSVACFAPGVVLADRYRIVAMIGHGGMGEVYRADDLRLGQPVALKFLPVTVERDQAARDRLIAEVRTARTVSHPNVCRVYDVGEVQGRIFLTMEYIDGEDLASLLRRIGRLPANKALEIARQLCAALAAAHERGVLHRDLKPANVMIDGRGQARITDFGLAIELAPAAGARVSAGGVATSAGGDECHIAGTIAYLAPERFSGQPATVQSDLYALGLVLYETYTGKHALSATTVEGWRRAHADSTPSNPSAHVADIEPTVERAILRCLEKDPARRPASAAQLAAALPGGDPLAAVIAAGETPSPELVAASGEEGTLPRGRAWLWLLACLAALAAAIPLAHGWHIENLVEMKRPEVQADAARRLLADIGYKYEPRDSVLWVEPSYDYAMWARQDQQPRDWFTASSRPFGPQLLFFYRQTRNSVLFTWQSYGIVTINDPAPRSEDDVLLQLDPDGRLLMLRVGGLFPNYDVATSFIEPRARMTDFKRLFDASGLDFASVSPVDQRRWRPVFAAETWEAWQARVAADTIHVEAASWLGRPVSWRVRPIWLPQWRPTATQAAVVLEMFMTLLIFGSAVVLAVLARHNVRAGRSDRRGAFRIALLVTVAETAFLALQRHWTFLAGEPLRFACNLLGTAFSAGLLVWLFYLGLEPFVRRRWPHLLVAWTRLLEGRWRDPLVGRSLLCGATGALLGAAVLPGMAALATRAFNLPLATPWMGADLNAPLAWLLASDRMPYVGPATAIVLVGVLLIGRLATRSDRGAWAFVLSTWFAVNLWYMSLGQRYDLIAPSAPIVVCLLMAVPPVVLLARQGLLAAAVCLTISTPLLNAPITWDVSRWYFWRTGVVVVIVCAVAFWGFRNVLGKQSAFPAGTLEV